MNLMDLDEAQGLTPQMVREWLLANQWEARGSSVAHLYYQCGSGEISEALLHEDLGWVVDLLAQSYERSVQSLLREINPRMRKGMPSKAALRAHRGLWLRFIGTETIATVLSRLIEEFPSPRDDKYLFWPCDDNGNKVRWPEKDGVML